MLPVASRRRRVPGLLSRAGRAVAIAYAALVLSLSLQQWLIPVRAGPLALGAIFAPYLFVPLIAAIPLAFGRGVVSERPEMALRALLVACAVVFVVRFGVTWVAFPRLPAQGSLEVGVTSWNLELGQPDPQAVVGALHAARAGVVGLVELTPRHADAIVADADLDARFPYRALFPQGGSTGVGLLSSYPIAVTPTAGTDPPLLVAQLSAEGRTLVVVVAHPLPGEIVTAGPLGIPSDFDPVRRDRGVAAVRAAVGPLIERGERFLLLGDFNVVDTEPTYSDLARDLVDVQRAVGFGPGFTWRPPAVQWLPFGVLRIDMIFATNGVAPLRITSDCTPRGSDHCIVRAAVEVP